MRWDNLDVQAEQERRLPGYRDPAVVRTFEAPEALNTRFYEVRARSVLNRVPERSPMPFRWTINPYRGCSHACLYCMSGATPVLMADGGTRPMADIRPGDAVYGTAGDGSHRRYVVTQVLDHWETSKPAYRVTLEDGTELVASGDHRFLTNRGWRHVVGAGRGPARRAYLTPNDELVGTGAFVDPVEHSADYRRGYLCGVARGYERLGGPGQASRACRVPDPDSRGRAREYLTAAGVAGDDRLLEAAGSARGEAEPSGSCAPPGLAQLRELMEWPRSATEGWGRGFLAGMFDAGGSHGARIRIAGADPALVERTTWSLRRLGFAYDLVESRGEGVAHVRIRGGVRERLRFFQTVDPAVMRKRSIAGRAIESDSHLRVVSIEPLGSAEALYDITTGTGDFIADGVVSHNCFARPTHTYLDFNAREDFEREIVVKVNAPEVVRAELSRPRWTREHVAMGTNTDPYQWVEGRYRLMPGIWEALRDSATPCSVLTKSPLVLRDVGLLQQVAKRAPVAANLSVPTLEERAWRATEPRTPSPRARLEAVRELNRAGIPTGVLIAPLMPGINDDPRQVEAIVELAADAGAVSIHGLALHLRGEVRGIFLDWLRAKRPDLVPRYEELYRRGAYAPQAERRRLADLVRHAGPSLPPRPDHAPAAEAGRPYSRPERWPRPSRPPLAPEGPAEIVQGRLF